MGLTSNVLILIEPCPHTAEEYGLVIASSNIIDASKETLKLQITNYSPRRIKLPKHLCLAHMNIVDSYNIASINSISSIKDLVQLLETNDPTQPSTDTKIPINTNRLTTLQKDPNCSR